MDFQVFQGLRLKITDNQTFARHVKAQLGELIFVLHRQTGLTLKMNFWRLGREWGVEEGRQSHDSGGRLGLCSEPTPGVRQTFLWLQPGGNPGAQVFMLHQPRAPQ